MTHPEHYLRCSKEVNGANVVTGWAPDLGAAKRHSVAVGGTVFVHNKNGLEIARFDDVYQVTDNVLAARELLACPVEVCYDSVLELAAE